MGLSATPWEPRKAWLSPGLNLPHPTTQPPQPVSSSALILSSQEEGPPQQESENRRRGKWGEGG